MDEKTKAEISLIVLIQDIMKTPDVPSVNKILHSTHALAEFRKVYGEPQLVITRAIMDKTLQPAHEAILEKSGRDVAQINQDSFQQEMESVRILGIGDSEEKNAPISEKISKLNNLMERMWLNKVGGQSLFGVGEIDKPEQTTPSPENFKHYVGVSKFHIQPELGKDCPDSLCKPFDPTALKTVGAEKIGPVKQ